MRLPFRAPSPWLLPPARSTSAPLPARLFTDWPFTTWPGQKAEMAVDLPVLLPTRCREDPVRKSKGAGPFRARACMVAFDICTDDTRLHRRPQIAVSAGCMPLQQKRPARGQAFGNSRWGSVEKGSTASRRSLLRPPPQIPAPTAPLPRRRPHRARWGCAGRTWNG